MRDRHRRLAGGRDAVDIGAYFRLSLALHKEGFVGRLNESFFHRLQWKNKSMGICWKRQKSEFSIETARPVIDCVDENCPRADRL
jgi:hypothetical protein